MPSSKINDFVTKRKQKNELLARHLVGPIIKYVSKAEHFCSHHDLGGLSSVAKMLTVVMISLCKDMLLLDTF